MDVLGRDSAREAYRVAAVVGGVRVVGLIPDTTIATGMNLTGGHGHQTAYDWLARNQNKIETTLTCLATGAGNAPIPTMVLAEE